MQNISWQSSQRSTVPAVLLQGFGLVGAVKKLPLEKLHSNNGEDEHEEDVNDEDVEHIFQRVHHAVKHGLGTHKQHKSDLLQTSSGAEGLSDTRRL